MLVWMGLQPTTTELGSDALTDWASTPWAQLAPRANFAQLLQFHYLFIVQFHFGYCRLSSYCLWHIYFNWNFLEVTSKCSYNFTVVVSTSIQTNSLKFQINFQSQDSFYVFCRKKQQSVKRKKRGMVRKTDLSDSSKQIPGYQSQN